MQPLLSTLGHLALSVSMTHGTAFGYGSPVGCADTRHWIFLHTPRIRHSESKSSCGRYNANGRQTRSRDRNLPGHRESQGPKFVSSGCGEFSDRGN